MQVVAGVRYRRLLTARDLFKFCARVSAQLLRHAGESAYLTGAV
jgi:hypothetical protein